MNNDKTQSNETVFTVTRYNNPDLSNYNGGFLEYKWMFPTTSSVKKFDTPNQSFNSNSLSHNHIKLILDEDMRLICFCVNDGVFKSYPEFKNITLIDKAFDIVYKLENYFDDPDDIINESDQNYTKWKFQFEPKNFLNAKLTKFIPIFNYNT